MSERRSPGSVRRVMASSGFRRLLAAQTISRWGDTFNAVALVIVVFQLTGSGVRVAGTVAFEIVPVLLFGFSAGALADRLPRRQLMIVADIGRAAVAATLAVAHGNLAVIYACAFALSALTVVFNPAAASLLPSYVEEQDDIVAANTAIWSSAVISQIVLAPAAAALVALAGPGPAFTINAATFVVSAAFIVALPTVRQAARTAGRHLSDVAEGLRLIRNSRFLSTLAAVQGLAALSAGATSALLVVLADRHLNVGAGRFGLLLAAIGIGAGVGPLMLHRLVDDPRRPVFLFGPYLLRGAVDLVLAASRNFGVALAALGIYGVGTSTGSITYQSVLQTRIDDHIRGRIFAFYDIVWQTARLASIAAGGLLADRIGIRAVYIAGGILLIAAGAIGLLAGRIDANERHVRLHPGEDTTPDSSAPPSTASPFKRTRATSQRDPAGCDRELRRDGIGVLAPRGASGADTGLTWEAAGAA